MLYFIGLGLNSKQLTKEAEFALRESDEIYVEGYTSIYSDGSTVELEKHIGKKFKVLYRNEVEERFKEVIDDATNNIVSFCVFGNITSATTHSSLIQECVEKQIEFKLLPGISIFSVIPMLTGLQEYRFGRTISIVKPIELYQPTSFFEYIQENKKQGLHTLCLLDIKIDKNQKYFMQPFEAASRLIEIGLEKKEKTVENWNCIVVSGACSYNQLVTKTTLGKLKGFVSDYEWPSSIVILGDMQMDEEEFIKTLDEY